MIAVCDSSVLINLSLINQLRLLFEMLGGVFIPPGVHDEVVRQGAGRAGAEDVQNAPFIQVKELHDPDAVEDYIDPLSPTDAAVIVLAKEQGADLVITHDRALRRRARREGFRVVSLVELLIEAKQSGFLQSVKPLLDELRNKGVLIREGVYQETLRQAGELPRGRRRRKV